MACKIKFIERDFREKDPDLADYLNEKYTELMKAIGDSGKFKRDHGHFYLSKENTKNYTDIQVPAMLSIYDRLTGGIPVFTNDVFSSVSNRILTVKVDPFYKYFIPKYFTEDKISWLNNKLLQADPEGIEQRTKVDDLNEQGDESSHEVTRYNRTIEAIQNLAESTQKAWGDEAVSKVADQLRNKFGIDYHIVSEDQARDILPGQYNGESAFYSKGEVYLVKGKFSQEDALHEYAHPFISAIAKDNPTLFDKLYSEVLNTTVGPALDQAVREAYTDIPEQYIREEVMVRALTQLTLSKSEDKGFLKKFLFAIRQLLRKILGTKVSLENLSLNTSLNDLANLFVSEKKFSINTEVLSQEDVAQFNKKLYDLADSLHEMIDSPLITLVKNITSHQSYKIIKGVKSYKHIKESVRSEGDVQDLATAGKHFKNAENESDLQTKAIDYAISLNAIHKFSGALIEDIKRIKEDDSIDPIEKARLLDAHQEILGQWNDFIQHVNEAIAEEEEDIPKGFKDYIAELGQTVNVGLSHIIKIQKNAAIDTLLDQLEPISIDAKRRLEEAKKRYEANPEAKGAEAKWEKDKAKFEARIFDRKSIEGFLNGSQKDVGLIQAKFASMAANDDPILGGMGTLIRTAYDKALEVSRKFTLDMNSEIADYLSSIDTTNPTKAYDKFVIREKQGYEDGDEYKTREVLSLLNPFRDYKVTLGKLKYDIRQARAAGDEVSLMALLQQRSQLESSWMHRKYTDEYYDIMKAWETPIGIKASERYRKITGDIDREEEIYSTSNPDEQKQSRERIKGYHRDLQRLSSLTDLQGNYKTGEDLEIAKFIKDQREATRDIYEYTLKKGVFESAYQSYKDELQASGLEEGSQDFNDKLDSWLAENTRVQLTEDYYKEKQTILDTIKRITSEYPSIVNRDMATSEAYEDIFNIASGYKDADNQIIGSDLNKDQISKIKSAEERIQTIKDAFDSYNGLTKDESAERTDLYTKVANRSISREESLRLTELNEKASSGKMSEIDRNILNNCFKQLALLSQKVPSDYYMETVKEWYGQLGVDPDTVTTDELEKLTDPTLIDKYAEENPLFGEWFKNNHILTTVFDKDSPSGVKEVYKRLYIWNKTIPQNQKYFKTTTMSDGRIVTGIPNAEYYRRSVKDEYRTQRIVGKTIDSSGAWLPKIDLKSPFINKDYFNLSPRDKSFLDTVTSYHFKAQEGLEGGKLGYEIPRFYKDTSETGIIGTVKNKVTELKNKATSYQEGLGNFDIDATNLSKYAKIPLKGIGRIDDLDKVSIDLPTIIQKYALSSFENQELVKIQPIAKAMSEVLKDNTGKKASQLNSKLAQISNIIFTSGGKQNESTRKRMYDSFYRTVFEGEIVDPDTNPTAFKVFHTLMGFAATTSLAANFPGALKNLTSGSIQGFIRSSGNKDITLRDYKKGERLSWGIVQDLIASKRTLKGLNLNAQLFDAFDPAMKERDSAGKRASGSYARDFYNIKWAHSAYEFGEYQIGIAFWQGMMSHQQVEQTLPDGTVRTIPYNEAFELKDGKAVLKAGIDSKWDLGGELFIRFKHRLHENMQYAQGNYDPITQPLAQKEILGRLFFFMRKYLVPSFISRFGRSGINVSLEDSDMEGYYLTAVKSALSHMGAYKGAYRWSNLSQEERNNVWRTLTELATVTSAFILLGLLGWDYNDKDRFKKVQENSWAKNMLLYQILAAKSETEQFIPIPGFGGDELLRMKNTPSIAFHHLDKLYNVLKSTLNYPSVWLGLEDASVLDYQQKSGIWEKGDSKWLANIVKALGYTGATLNPDVAIKNFTIAQSRTR